MANYAYLRVSTGQQDVDNQKHGILEYCNKKGIMDLKFIEDTVSGTKKWQDRKLGKLITDISAGDKIIVSEVSRLARSTLQVLEIAECVILVEAGIYIVKENLIFDDDKGSDVSSKMMLIMFGMVAEIERKFISLRTKEALDRRRAAGLPLGRPKGAVVKKKLDGKEKEIQKYLDLELSIVAMSKLLNVNRITLTSFIKSKNLEKNKEVS